MAQKEFDPEDLTRRDRMMLFRDLLLVLEMNTRPMKPTLVMYAMNMSWAPMVKLVQFMNKKQLVEISKPERLNTRGRPRTDKRSNARIGVTLKGKYMLRLLDEMIRYLYDEAPPVINPPIWLMRKALETKGFLFVDDLQALDKRHLLEAPRDDPTPFGLIVEKPEDAVIPLEVPSLSPGEKGDVLFSLTEKNPVPPIRDNRPYEKASALAAGFTVRKPAEAGLHCPECGHRAGDLRGLTTHVEILHPEKKEEIMALVTKYHANVA